MAQAELELVLRPGAAGLVADLALRSPGASEAELVRDAPVAINQALLLEQSLDPDA